MFPLFGFLFAMAIVFAIMALVRRSKVTTPMTEMPKRSRQVVAPLAPSEALKFVIRYAQSAGYRTEQLDEAAGRVVFADPSRSLVDTGPTCFYPVVVSARSEGGSLIEIGVKSQYWQVVGLDGPLDNFVAGLRAAAFAQGSSPSP